MKEFMKKYWIIVLVLFIMPIALLAIYSYYSSDALSDYSVISSAFTYYGTIILALVTVLQNEKITELSLRNAEVDEIKLRNQFHPIINLEYIMDQYQKPIKGEQLYKSRVGTVEQIDTIDGNTLYVVLKNTGNASAFNMAVFDYSYVGFDGEHDHPYDYKIREKQEIPQQDGYVWELHIFENSLFEFTFNLCYENEFGNSYYHNVYVALGDNNGKKWAQVGIGEQYKGKVSMDLQESYFRTDTEQFES